MEAQYKKNENYDKTIYLQNKELSYISNKRFNTLFPKGQGGYLVIGAIGAGKKKEEKGSWTWDAKEYLYYALNESRFSYGIDGYVEVGENVYIAVLKKQLSRNLFFVFFALLITAGSIFVSIAWWNREQGPDLDPAIAKYKAVIKKPENHDPTRILIPGYKDITMEAGTNIAYIALANPEENPCYFQFTVIEDKTQNILYEGKLIPPGYAITKIKLKKTMKKGIYPVTVRITTYDLENYKVKLNGGEVKAQLLVIQRKIKKQ